MKLIPSQLVPEKATTFFTFNFHLCRLFTTPTSYPCRAERLALQLTRHPKAPNHPIQTQDPFLDPVLELIRSGSRSKSTEKEAEGDSESGPEAWVGDGDKLRRGQAERAGDDEERGPGGGTRKQERQQETGGKFSGFVLVFKALNRVERPSIPSLHFLDCSASPRVRTRFSRSRSDALHSAFVRLELTCILKLKTSNGSVVT